MAERNLKDFFSGKTTSTIKKAPENMESKSQRASIGRTLSLV
jgi:hypothetical protein